MSDKPKIPDKESSDPKDKDYWRPDDVPPDLSLIDRSIIAARNVRAWADWLLETGPAPEKGDDLRDIGDRKGDTG